MPAKLLIGTLDTGVGDVGVTESVVAGVVDLVVAVRVGVTVGDGDLTDLVVAGMVDLVVEVRVGVTVALVELKLTALHSEEMPSSTNCTLLAVQEV